MTLIQGAIAGLKTASDIVIGLSKLNTLAQVQEKSVELGQVIVAAQSATLSAYADQAAMVDEIRALKKEIADVKAWESQKQRYQLTPLGDGAGVVYALKKTMSQSEPPHWVCTKCYEEGKRMILQPASVNGFSHLICPSCNLDIPANQRRLGPPAYANG